MDGGFERISIHRVPVLFQNNTVNRRFTIMKKILMLGLVVTMLLSICSLSTFAEEETVTPNVYWDFVESMPKASNLDAFKEDGELTYSEDGNLVLTAIEADDPTGHLQIFINEEDKGGTSLKDHDAIVARFRVKDNTYIKDYKANVGYIGYKWQEGDQAYIRPAYLNTYDWQVMYLDFQSDYYKSDAWYFVWFWFADALFPIEIEIDYIATFANMDDAKAYVKQQGHDTEPEIITEATTEAPETPEESETEPVTAPVIQQQTAQRTTADGTQEPDETVPQTNDGATEAPPVSPVVWIVVAAVVVVIAVVVVVVIKKKK